MTDHENTGPENTDPLGEGSAMPAPPPPPPGADAPPRVALGADGAAAVQTPPPSVPLWQRIQKRLLIGGAVVLVIVIIGFVANRGKTNATDLSAGDCFEAPSGGDIRDVKDQSCDGLHDVEILVVTNVPAGSEWPGLNPFALGDTPASEACFNAIDPNLIIFENVPDDTLEGHYYPDQSAWDDGDRKILCYAQSETGFPGPVMTRE